MRNILLTVHQHGGDDVTCKPRIQGYGLARVEKPERITMREEIDPFSFPEPSFLLVSSKKPRAVETSYIRDSG
jgi:hypothetical protein